MPSKICFDVCNCLKWSKFKCHTIKLWLSSGRQNHPLTYSWFILTSLHNIATGKPTTNKEGDPESTNEDYSAENIT